MDGLPNFARDPDWLLLGAEVRPSGYVVLASDQLGYVELRSEMQMLARYSQNIFEEWADPNNRKWSLNTSLRKFRLSYGETYAEALANLFRDWSPDKSGQLEPAQREIEG